MSSAQKHSDSSCTGSTRLLLHFRAVQQILARLLQWSLLLISLQVLMSGQTCANPYAVRHACAHARKTCSQPHAVNMCAGACTRVLTPTRSATEHAMSSITIINSVLLGLSTEPWYSVMFLQRHPASMVISWGGETCLQGV